MGNRMAGATRYTPENPEIRRPGITAIMEEIRAESPDFDDEDVEGLAKVRWHERKRGDA